MKYMILSVLCVLLSGAAMAQDADHYFYVSDLGDADYFTATGTRLTDACAIVQQERANYHLYGIRDDGDVSDPVFGAPEMRARIPDICVVTPDFAQQIVNGVARSYAVHVKRHAGGEVFEMRIVAPAQLHD